MTHDDPETAHPTILLVEDEPALREGTGRFLRTRGYRVLTANDGQSALAQIQQADAIIAAREKIVEGAVSMVKMALTKLADENVVELDDDKKASMVSNLMVVLCGDDTAQPVVNTGTLNM